MTEFFQTHGRRLLAVMIVFGLFHALAIVASVRGLYLAARSWAPTGHAAQAPLLPTPSAARTRLPAGLAAGGLARSPASAARGEQ